MEIVLLLLLSVGSLLYLRRYLRPILSIAERDGPRYTFVDVTVIGSLMALLLYNAWTMVGHVQTITIQLILESSIIYLSLVILLLGILVFRKLSPIALFGLNWRTWHKDIPPAILALLCVYPILLLIQMSVVHIFGKQSALQDVLHFLENAKGWDERGSVVVMAVLCAPIAEEVIFRGYLLGVIRQYLGVWAALIGSSLIFALIHAHIPSAPGLFVLGLVLAAVYQRTGSLWAPMLLHSIFNAITIAFTLAWPKVAPLQ